MTVQNLSMAKPAKKPPQFDWHLRAWFDALGITYPHPWLQRECGYSDGKASNVLTGKKRYDRDLVNEISAALKIAPFELLMHPAEAMALRAQRQSALTLHEQIQQAAEQLEKQRKAG